MRAARFSCSARADRLPAAARRGHRPGSTSQCLYPLSRAALRARRFACDDGPMPFFTIPFPAIDPVALAIGPFAIRWYALAYIAGLLLGWRYCLWLSKKPPLLLRPVDIDDFLTWATLGVVVGGRVGYVLFYRPGFYIDNPSQILAVWHGGMSFHGGCAG